MQTLVDWCAAEGCFGVDSLALPGRSAHQELLRVLRARGRGRSSCTAPCRDRGPGPGVGAVVVDHDRLLMVRRGRGPAAGAWSVPGGRVEARRDPRRGRDPRAPRRRRASTACAGRCWVGSSGSSDDGHFVILDFEVTLVGDDQPVAGDDAAEAAWVDLHEVAELTLVEGVAELLHDNGIIATFT